MINTALRRTRRDNARGACGKSCAFTVQLLAEQTIFFSINKGSCSAVHGSIVEPLEQAAEEEAGSVSGAAKRMITQLYDLADEHGFDFLAFWIPRELNTRCDALSTCTDARAARLALPPAFSLTCIDATAVCSAAKYSQGA